jgi:O-antigen/teichoic acid export membrane protein
MIRPVIGTIATRTIIMLMNIGVVMLAGHRLGAEGLGDISLVLLGITFIMLLNNVVGGGAIIYLLPRHGLRGILMPSYAWAIFSTLVALMVIHQFPLVPAGTELHVVALALIQGIYTIHFSVLLGRQRIAQINFLQVLHAMVLLGVFALLVLESSHPSVMDYIVASYYAFVITLIGSIVLVSLVKFPPKFGRTSVLGAMVRHGGFIQLANFLQLLNYRLAYYLIERSHGIGALGIYSVGNQLAESAWLGPKSLGAVLYARISNTEDGERSRQLTITGVKVAFLMALAVIMVIILLPDVVYQKLFGEEIQGITQLALLLSPGILAMAASQAFSHYFSGVGRNMHNAIGSGIGVVVTLVLGQLLIPRYGIDGAAIAASSAYLLNTVYQWIVFNRTTKTTLSEFMIGQDDRERILKLMQRIK